MCSRLADSAKNFYMVLVLSTLFNNELLPFYPWNYPNFSPLGSAGGYPSKTLLFFTLLPTLLVDVPIIAIQTRIMSLEDGLVYNIITYTIWLVAIADIAIRVVSRVPALTALCKKDAEKRKAR